MDETMATIRKRGPRWQVQIRRQGYPAISKSFLEKADAQRWGREQEVTIDRGDVSRPVEVRHTTLKDVLAKYEIEISPRKRSPSDPFLIRQICKHEISEIPVVALSCDAMARFRDNRLRTVSGSTVRKEMHLITHALKVAKIEWGIPTKPDELV